MGIDDQEPTDTVRQQTYIQHFVDTTIGCTSQDPRKVPSGLAHETEATDIWP